MIARAPRALLLALAMWIASAALAQLAVPPLTARVTDQTSTLSAPQREGLEQTLAEFEARKGVQLAVLLVPSTAPEQIEQYALRVAEQWKLGRAKVNDGVILVVATRDRKLRIEVGYGLEGVLPDIVASRIINETIVPRFAANDIAGGVLAGAQAIMRVVEGEPLPAPAAGAKPAELPPSLPVLAMLAIAAGALLPALLGRVAGSLATGVLVAAAAWFLAGAALLAAGAGLAAMLFTLAGGPMLLARHGHGGSHGRRGGFGGGFRGGGGGFGGGGATGRW